ncbi:hypothetical protein [Thiolapillus sp.]
MNEKLPAVQEPKGEHIEEADYIDLGAEDVKIITEKVEELTVRLKKIVTTDEGKLQIVMETEGIADDEALQNIKHMLTLQQTGMIVLSMKAMQRDLFDG